MHACVVPCRNLTFINRNGFLVSFNSLCQEKSQVLPKRSSTTASTSKHANPPGIKRGSPCTVEGCRSKVMARGLCIRHGAFGTCIAIGCTTNAVSWKRRLCWKHDPTKVKKKCSVSGCTTWAHARGVCYVHSSIKPTRTKYTCCVPGCKSGEVKNYLCKAHGAYGVCTALLCAVVAVNKTGYCTKHGALGWCPVAGCNNAIRARGRCHTHGGGSARTRVCDWEGCTTFAEARRRCAKHGAHGMCAYGECAILNKEMFA